MRNPKKYTKIKKVLSKKGIGLLLLSALFYIPSLKANQCQEMYEQCVLEAQGELAQDLANAERNYYECLLRFPVEFCQDARDADEAKALEDYGYALNICLLIYLNCTSIETLIGG